MSKRIVSEERIAESRRSERITKMSEEFGTEMEGERERGSRTGTPVGLGACVQVEGD